jgi:hypothetical protein
MSYQDLWSQRWDGRSDGLQTAGAGLTHCRLNDDADGLLDQDREINRDGADASLLRAGRPHRRRECPGVFHVLPPQSRGAPMKSTSRDRPSEESLPSKAP